MVRSVPGAINLRLNPSRTKGHQPGAAKNQEMHPRPGQPEDCCFEEA